MSDDENYLIWQSYIKSVNPLSNIGLFQNDVSDSPPKITTALPSKIITENQPLLPYSNPLETTLNFIPHQSPKIHHHSFKSEKNAKKRMKKGQFIFKAKIDLHGYTQDQAFDSLQKFITYHYHKQNRQLLIITGQGRYCYQTLSPSGILINKVPEWLKSPPFASMISVIEKASMHDGGDGALYVILRKK